MASWETRLTPLLGAPPALLTYADLEALVAAATEEDPQLDFKGTLYGASDSDRREMAADIAAMANDRGGVILLGVAETDGVASDLPGVEISDAEMLRIRQTVTGLVAPHLDLEIRRIESETPGRGILMLLVPPSRWRPHAVRKGHDLRYPRRDGTSKRWMAESEVADLYRNRFQDAGSDVERLEEVIEEAVSRVALGGRGLEKATEREQQTPWLLLGLVPEGRGALPIRLRTIQETAEWARQYYENGVRFTGLWPGHVQVVAGVGRATVRLYNQPPVGIRSTYAEFHSDGSGAIAAPLFWPPHQDEPAILDNLLLSDAGAGLRALGDHAVNRAGAWGGALVEARIEAPADLMLVYARGMDHVGRVHAPDSNQTLIKDIPARHSLALGDLVGSDSQLLAALKLLMTDVFQAFGTPEIRQLTDEGAIRIEHWPQGDRADVTTWAEQHEVPISLEMLPVSNG